MLGLWLYWCRRKDTPIQGRRNKKMNQYREAKGKEAVEEDSCLLEAIWDGGPLAMC
jgi:hypothetical protein